MRSTYASLALIFLCVPVGACRPGPATLTDEQAATLLEEHTAALASGDTSRIKQYWAEQSSSRDGFWFMHGWRGNRIKVSDWAGFLDGFTYDIATIDRGDHFTMVDINWIPTAASGNVDSAEVRPMRYYVVWEKGRWVLSNPVDAITSDW